MEDYIPYRLAIKLKEKGYPMKEIQTWERDNRSIPVLYELSKDHPDWQYCKTWWIPTIYQVLKWLREEKCIHITIDADVNDNFSFYYTVLEKGVESWDVLHYCEGQYKSYEKAALAGIEYTLDNLI